MLHHRHALARNCGRDCSPGLPTAYDERRARAVVPRRSPRVVGATHSDAWIEGAAMTRFTYARLATPAEAEAIRAKRANRTALSNEAKALITEAVVERVKALPRAVDGAPGV